MNITPGLVAIRDRKTGKYVTQAAFELWEDGHDIDGVDLWADDIDFAAWMMRDDAPSGLDVSRFELVPVLPKPFRGPEIKTAAEAEEYLRQESKL